MTLQEAADYVKSFGVEKAMAFDGGSSTSFENGALSITSVGDDLGRKVKSFLAVRALEGDNRPTSTKMFR